MATVVYRRPKPRRGDEKLTDDDVRQIRARWERGGIGSTQAEIAEDYDVTAMTISNVVRRKTYRHVR